MESHWDIVTLLYTYWKTNVYINSIFVNLDR